MASRRTLNAANLQTLGAPALAELLIELSSGSAVMQRRLRLALAAADGVETAAQEVRKRLAAIARSSTFVGSRQRASLLADLEAQRQMISGPIAVAEPALALELLLRFLELADPVLARCSDTTGSVMAVFEEAIEALVPLAAAAQLPASALAEHGLELLGCNGHGQFDGLIPVLAEALGDSGLAWLQAQLEQHGGVDASWLLVQIAEARGDVDAYLAQFDASQLGRPSTAAAVALRLLAAGRAGQALKILDGAADAAARWPVPEWEEARITVLDQLDRPEEAQQQRWLWFSRTLATAPLKAYLQRLEAFEDVEVEERALQLAEAHDQPLLALQFLIAWPALARAARLVLRHRQHWDGEAHGIQSEAAERLSADHPLAATVLLRPMVVFALAMGRSRRYRHAAEHLRSCEQLAARIDDWQGIESHSTFLGRLREAYAREIGFWRLLER